MQILQDSAIGEFLAFMENMLSWQWHAGGQLSNLNLAPLLEEGLNIFEKWSISSEPSQHRKDLEDSEHQSKSIKALKQADLLLADWPPNNWPPQAPTQAPAGGGSSGDLAAGGSPGGRAPAAADLQPVVGVQPVALLWSEGVAVMHAAAAARSGLDKVGGGGEEEERSGGEEEERSGGEEKERSGGEEKERSGGEEKERSGGQEEERSGGQEEERSGGEEEAVTPGGRAPAVVAPWPPYAQIQQGSI